MDDFTAEEFAEALMRLKAKFPQATLNVSWYRLTILIGMLQVALTNPEVEEFALTETRWVVETILDKMAAYEPRLAQCLRHGLDPRYGIVFLSPEKYDDRPTYPPNPPLESKA